jgi:hypothetical protein
MAEFWESAPVVEQRAPAASEGDWWKSAPPATEEANWYHGSEVVHGGEVPLASLKWGLGTIFGLNPDGTPDTQDNGRGAPRLGSRNTRDPNLIGVALPESVLREQLGNDPAAWRRAKVQAMTPDGKSITAPIVDLGPGDEPQARNVSIDLTYGAQQALGTSGNDPVGYRIIPDAQPDPLDNHVGLLHDLASRFINATAAPIAKGLEGSLRIGSVQSSNFLGALIPRAATDRLADILRENLDESLWATNPARDATAPAQVAGAAGGVFGSVPMMATGPLALPLLAASGATGAYANTYDQSVAQGNSDQEAKRDGVIAALKTAPELAGYLVAGKAGAMAAGRILGPAATPLVRGIVGGAVALPANMVASSTIRAAESGHLADALPNAGSLTTDALFAIFHGTSEASSAKAHAAAEELAHRGVDPVTGTQSPVAEVPFMAREDIPYLTKLAIIDQLKRGGSTDEQIDGLSLEQVRQLTSATSIAGSSVESQEVATTDPPKTPELNTDQPSAPTPGSPTPATTELRREQAPLSAEEEAYRKAEMEAQAEAMAEFEGHQEQVGAMELLDAVKEAGGLPAKGSEHWTGEMETLFGLARGAGQSRIMRTTAPHPDHLAGCSAIVDLTSKATRTFGMRSRSDCAPETNNTVGLINRMRRWPVPISRPNKLRCRGRSTRLHRSRNSRRANRSRRRISAIIFRRRSTFRCASGCACRVRRIRAGSRWPGSIASSLRRSGPDCATISRRSRTRWGTTCIICSSPTRRAARTISITSLNRS